MKDLIKKILREETSGLTDGQIKAGYTLMNMITKGYHWYSSPYGVWLINPDTKEWMLHLKNSGDLWYFDDINDIFYRYLNMGVFDFRSFIKIWVEDVLKRGVVSTFSAAGMLPYQVEDALKRGVVSTVQDDGAQPKLVEDVLKHGKQLK